MSGVKVSRDNVAKLMKSLHALTKSDVLVGVPTTRADRKEKGDPVSNAEIAYWMEFGAPAANIPARPALIPGVKDAQPTIVAQLKAAAVAGLKGEAAEVLRSMNMAGLAAQNAVRNRIRAGIAPALSERTLQARARRGRKGAKQELANRADGQQPSLDLAKPLIDTGALLKSYTYVIRKK